MGTYAKLKLPLLALLFLSMGCTQSFEGLSNKTLKPISLFCAELFAALNSARLSKKATRMNERETNKNCCVIPE